MKQNKFEKKYPDVWVLAEDFEEWDLETYVSSLANIFADYFYFTLKK